MTFANWLRSCATAWLGRELTANDGVPRERIEAAGTRLGIKVPAALQTLYERVGQVPELMTAFQQFLSPEHWEIRDGRCLFLEENQGVCAWAVDTEDSIWMLVDDQAYPENLNCEEFLRVLLPYQLAQGGFPYTGIAYTQDDDTYPVLEEAAMTLGWPLIADHNGLRIYGHGGHVLWALSPTDGHVYLSSRDEDDYNDVLDQIDFDEL